jgi:hypothetical protein
MGFSVLAFVVVREFRHSARHKVQGTDERNLLKTKEAGTR